MNQITRDTASPGGTDDEHGPSAILWTVERDTTTTSHRAPDNRPVPLSAPIRWFIGAVIAIGALGGLVRFANARVESELVDQTNQALAAAGLDPSAYEIDFDFRDGTVVGTLPDGWSEARFESEVQIDSARSLFFEDRRPLTAQETDS